MSRKRNHPQEDPETSLFHESMQDVTPLQHDKATPFRSPRRPEPLPPAPEYSPKAAQEAFADIDIETPEELLFLRPGVQQRLIRELRRGRISPTAELDLHGLRVKQARGVLAAFLNRVREQHLRCIRIIHGKGRGSADSQPILKQKTNQWLRQRREVLAFCSAPPFDGGTGATYVLLSRKSELPER
jgi:DNA-nicking Smr family endonuclease